ncbi:MAG: hypothetical protein ACI92E_003108 [Oceanicoccus sp.]
MKNTDDGGTGAEFLEVDAETLTLEKNQRVSILNQRK